MGYRFVGSATYVTRNVSAFLELFSPSAYGRNEKLPSLSANSIVCGGAYRYRLEILFGSDVAIASANAATR